MILMSIGITSSLINSSYFASKISANFLAGSTLSPIQCTYLEFEESEEVLGLDITVV